MIKSDAGIFLWMTYQTMLQAGIDCQKIFASVNMADLPPDPKIRRDNSTQQRFWQAAEQVTANPNIGLYIGSLMPVFRGQVLEYLFLSSPTFGEGLKRALRYRRLITDALQLELIIEGDTARLVGFEHPVRHYLECALAVFLGFLRHVSAGHFIVQEICLPYINGADLVEYQRVYQAPVRLACTRGEIRFTANLLQASSPAPDNELFMLHDDLAYQRLLELARHDLIHQIETKLGDLLESQQLSLETTAQVLAYTPRQLRAELAYINTNFNDVVARYRERLARRLLAKTTESLENIVYLTGFSEPSAFTRAFKRWTGETPSQYRQRKQRT